MLFERKLDECFGIGILCGARQELDHWQQTYHSQLILSIHLKCKQFVNETFVFITDLRSPSRARLRLIIRSGVIRPLFGHQYLFVGCSSSFPPPYSSTRTISLHSKRNPVSGGRHSRAPHATRSLYKEINMTHYYKCECTLWDFGAHNEHQPSSTIPGP